MPRFPSFSLPEPFFPVAPASRVSSQLLSPRSWALAHHPHRASREAAQMAARTLAVSSFFTPQRPPGTPPSGCPLCAPDLPVHTACSGRFQEFPLMRSLRLPFLPNLSAFACLIFLEIFCPRVGGPGEISEPQAQFALACVKMVRSLVGFGVVCLCSRFRLPFFAAPVGAQIGSDAPSCGPCRWRDHTESSTRLAAHSSNSCERGFRSSAMPTSWHWARADAHALPYGSAYPCHGLVEPLLKLGPFMPKFR